MHFGAEVSVLQPPLGRVTYKAPFIWKRTGHVRGSFDLRLGFGFDTTIGLSFVDKKNRRSYQPITVALT